MKEKLKPNKTYDEFQKRAREHFLEYDKEISAALEKAHQEYPNLGIGGYEWVEAPIRDKYYKKYLELCNEFFEIVKD